MPRMPSRHPLGGLACAAFAAAALTAGVSGSASAATLTTDARCYEQGAPLRLTAAELEPRAPLVVALDGQPLRYRDGTLPAADAEGAFASSFATPALASGVNQQRHTLAVDDGTQRARARFTVSRTAGATFAPSAGDPRTLRARFSVWGFAFDGVSVRTWLHWIGPGGRVRANAALGVTRGHCGALTTGLRRVFPFAPAPGRWQLVIDTRQRYRVHDDGPRAKIPVHLRSLAPRS